MGKVRTFILLTLGALAYGQLKSPAFDVTSVKPHARGTPPIPQSCSDGRFISTDALLRVIKWAYDLKPYQLLDVAQKLPQWTRGATGTYDIEARSESPVTEAQCRQMVQTLLADRFQFVAHTERREAKVFDLVVARGGPKMPKVTDADQSPGINVTRNGIRGRASELGFRGLTMSDFAEFLDGSMTPRLPVIDRTGLEGLFKIDLTYSTPQAAGKQEFRDPDLNSALELQLGLKLEERKGPVDFLVVDRIEPPDPN